MTKTRLVPLTACAIASLCASVAIHKLWPANAAWQMEQLPVIAVPGVPTAIVSHGRTVYPYSVIPGGVYADTDLRSALLRDLAVRTHYADFDTAKLRFVRLQAESYRYVSYRRGDEIYWTKKQLLLPRGELLISDGVHYARARCGNRLALFPPASTKPSSQIARNDALLPPDPDSGIEPPDTHRINDGMGIPDSVPGQPTLLPNLDSNEGTETPISGAPNQQSRPAGSFYIPSWPFVFVPSVVGQANGSPSGSTASSNTTPPVAIPTPVPEGSVAGLTAFGFSVLWWIRRRRTAKPAVITVAITSGENRPQR